MDFKPYKAFIMNDTLYDLEKLKKVFDGLKDYFPEEEGSMDLKDF
jgi:hypothetical protein